MNGNFAVIGGDGRPRRISCARAGGNRRFQGEESREQEEGFEEEEEEGFEEEEEGFEEEEEGFEEEQREVDEIPQDDADPDDMRRYLSRALPRMEASISKRGGPRPRCIRIQPEVHHFTTEEERCDWLWDSLDDYVVDTDIVLLSPPCQLMIMLAERYGVHDTYGWSARAALVENGWPIISYVTNIRYCDRQRYSVMVFTVPDIARVVSDLEANPYYRDDANVVFALLETGYAQLTRAGLELLYDRFLVVNAWKYSLWFSAYMVKLWDSLQNIEIPTDEERYVVTTHEKPSIFGACPPDKTLYFGLTKVPAFFFDLTQPALFPDVGEYMKTTRSVPDFSQHIYRMCSKCGGRLLKWETGTPCCSGISEAQIPQVKARFPTGPDPDLAKEIISLTNRDCTYARRVNHGCSPIIRNASIGHSRPSSALTRIEGCPYAYDPGSQHHMQHFIWTSLRRPRGDEIHEQERVFIAMVTHARLLEANEALRKYVTLRTREELPQLVVEYVTKALDMNSITIAITNTQRFRPNPAMALAISRDGDRYNRLIPSYTAEYDHLVYPLLFPEGTGGFGRLHDEPKGFPGLRCIFKCFLHQPPATSFAHQSGLLMEELIADTYGRYFDNKLTYAYQRVKHMLREDEIGRTQNLDFGRRLFIPASIPGSKAYFNKLNYDAAALTLKLGNCTWFLTVTCNPKWFDLYSTGVTDYALNSFNVTRVFKLKVQKLMNILKSKQILGPVRGYMYRYEYQNRGLPHVHILLWTDVDVDDPDIVNQYVTAELPPKDDNDESVQRWRLLAQKYQYHHHSSRCGHAKTGKCCYNYPQKAAPFTVPYGRRMQLRRRKAEDAHIVPYNPELLNLLRCNMDLEVVSSTQCPAYTLKYTSKDSSHADLTSRTVKYHGQEVNDDFHYWMATKVTGTSECVMELLGCDRYSMSPTVIVLPLHLKDRRIIIVDEQDTDPDPPGMSPLQRYFHRPLDPSFDHITMLEYYEHFDIGGKGPGVQDQGDDAGRNRVQIVAYKASKRKVARFKNYLPSVGELYYLKVLLTHIPARSFDDLYAYQGVVHETYHQVAVQRGLVPDENDGIVAIKEAIIMKLTPATIRGLCIILMKDGHLETQQLCEPNVLSYLTQDVPGLSPDERFPKLKRMLGQTIHDHGDDPGAYHLDYDGPSTLPQTDEQEMPLTDEQQAVIDDILKYHRKSTGALLYLQGRAGTGKTHTVKQLIRLLREDGVTVTPCGSTGIAASQYQGGQTVHKCFKFAVDDDIEHQGVFTSTVGRHTALASRLLATKLFIFDEASMITPDLLDRVDQTLRFIDPQGLHRFAGANILLVGDFLQLPPVVTNSAAPVIDRLLLRSEMWHSVRSFALTKPMRCPDEIYHTFITELANNQLETYTRWSQVPGITVTYEVEDAYRFLLNGVSDDHPYPLDQLWIAGTNRVVADVNLTIQNRRLGTKIPIDAIAWHVIDTMAPHDHALTNNMALVYLNAYEDPGMPPPKLRISPTDPVFLLRNLDTANGLVKGLRANIATVAPTGRLITLTKADGQEVTLPRICFKGNLNGAAFTRRQLPVRLAYAGTVHRAQGESLRKVVVDLRRSFWEHGQLYVAMSRVRQPAGCLVLLPKPATVTYDPDIITPVADNKVVSAILDMEERV